MIENKYLIMLEKEKSSDTITVIASAAVISCYTTSCQIEIMETMLNS